MRADRLGPGGQRTCAVGSNVLSASADSDISPGHGALPDAALRDSDPPASARSAEAVNPARVTHLSGASGRARAHQAPAAELQREPVAHAHLQALLRPLHSPAPLHVHLLARQAGVLLAGVWNDGYARGEQGAGQGLIAWTVSQLRGTVTSRTRRAHMFPAFRVHSVCPRDAALSLPAAAGLQENVNVENGE